MDCSYGRLSGTPASAFSRLDKFTLRNTLYISYLNWVIFEESCVVSQISSWKIALDQMPSMVNTNSRSWPIIDAHTHSILRWNVTSLTKNAMEACLHEAGDSGASYVDEHVEWLCLSSTAPLSTDTMAAAVVPSPSAPATTPKKV